MLSLFVAELYRNKTLEMPFRNIAYTTIGVIYISVPFALLNFFVYPKELGYTYEPNILLSLLFFIWASDSGAYLIGSKFGKHRLFERISPKKSWEGFFGGLGAAILVAAILAQFWEQYSFFPLAIIAAITVIAGTFGDLIESMLKRSLGVKDSGNFMPGHGGLLDRFDSILIAIPMVYFILVFLR
jgi:phosphatidate cytidylyltransferase